MDHVVLAEIAWATTMAGHPTLRFNFRGVGGSQGERSGEEECAQDAEAALHVLIENAGHTEVVVARTLLVCPQTAPVGTMRPWTR